MLKTFIIERLCELSIATNNVSGYRAVGEGCLLDSGEVVVYWFDKKTNTYNSLIDFINANDTGSKVIFKN